MLRTVLLVACFCALALSCAEASPAYHKSSMKGQFADLRKLAGSACSQPDMRPCGGGDQQPHFGKEITQKSNKHGHKSVVINRKEVTHHSTAKPRAWCGWYLARHLGIHDRRLWRALAWRHVGRAADGPAIGAIVIWSRGKGGGHVGIITGKTERGWVVLSGNDGNAVRERVRSVSTAIAFRWP